MSATRHKAFNTVSSTKFQEVETEVGAETETETKTELSVLLIELPEAARYLTITPTLHPPASLPLPLGSVTMPQMKVQRETRFCRLAAQFKA